MPTLAPSTALPPALASTPVAVPAAARALIYDRFGGPEVYRWHDVAIALPRRRGVLLRVRAAALNPKDLHIRSGRFRWMSGSRFPKRAGIDFAGEVVAAGAGSDWAPGMRVFGALHEWRFRRGTLADYIEVVDDELTAMPPGMSFEDAAALPLVALTALQALRDVARVEPGDRVLIHGASGGVGTAAIQIAKAMGAIVTATSSAANRALCLSLGADDWIDRTRFARVTRGGGEGTGSAGPEGPGTVPSINAFAGPANQRVVFDAYGNLALDRVRPVLAARGCYVTTVPSRRIFTDLLRTLVSHPRARLVRVRPRRADLAFVAELVATGRLRPIIDRVVSADDIVGGMQHLASKRARGKIVVAMTDPPERSRHIEPENH